MKSNHADVNGSESRDLLAHSDSSATQVRLEVAAVEPGVLETEHSRLMQLQGNKADEQQLVKLASEFIAQVRPLGLQLENGKERKHWQGILDYWSIFVYRVQQLDIEADSRPFDPEHAPTLTDAQYPYSFTQESAPEAQHMLGWRKLLDECERDLAGDHLLTVVGETASGRSSFLHQLLLPIMQAGRARRPELQGSEEWRYCSISLGQEPIEDVLRAFMDQAERDHEWVARQAKVIRREPNKLAAILEPGFETTTLIAIDEFESLLKSSAEDRDVVVRALASLLDDLQRRYILAVTLRRGQTRELAKFGPLEQTMRHSHVLFAFTTAELRHLIEEPAKRVGLVFDPGVIDQILINIQGEPRALPLLQFTLRRLWRLRVRNRITREALEACGAGTSAIVKAMDAVYWDQNEQQRVVFQSVLLEMVNLEPTGQFEPIAVSRHDLINICGDQFAVQAVIARLRDENLIYERTVGAQQKFALTNWTVLTAWPPMVAWLDELRLKHRFRLRLKEAADSWEKRHRSEDLLWRGVSLAEADREFSSDVSLTTPERDFLDAGRNREVKKARRRYAISGLLIASVFLAIVAFVSMKSHTVKQQQRLANAIDALIEGDFPKSLLWLQSRARSAVLLEDTRLDARMEELMRLQVPELELRRAGEQDKDKFDDMSVSPDGRYIATIRSNVASKEFCLEVSEVGNIGAVSNPIPRPFKSGIDSTAGKVIFASVGSDSYLIVATDNLLCWRVDGTSPKNWKLVDLRLPEPRVDASVAALASNAGLLAITWKKKEASSLDLYELSSDNDGLQLNLLPQPDGLNQNNVRIVSLSTRGWLVVVSGEEIDQAKTLAAWMRSPSGDAQQNDKLEWTRAKLPDWVFDLQAARSPRLVDWGWAPTDEKDERDRVWQCLDSYIKAVSFSPSGTDFATASNDGQVLVWSIAEMPAVGIVVSPKIETELRLGSSIFDVAFLNNQVLATGGRDRTTRFWNLHSGIEVAPRNYHEATVVKLQFAGPGQLLTRTMGILRSWRSPAYVELDTPCLVGNLAVSSESHQVFVTQSSSTGAVATTLDGGLPKELGLEATVLDGKFGALTEVSPNGEWTLDASEVANSGDENKGMAVQSERSLTLRRSTELESPKQLLGLKGLKSVPRVVFSPGGECHRLVIAEPNGDGTPPQVSYWELGQISSEANAAQGQAIKLPHEKVTVTIQKNAHNKEATYSHAQLTINRLALKRFKDQDLLVIVGKQKTDDAEKGIVFIGTADASANAPWVLKRLVIDRDEESLDGFPHAEEVLCVGISPNGEYLATGDAHDVVKIWSTKELLRACKSQDEVAICQPDSIFEHSSNVELLAFSPTGTELLTVSSEGEAALWSMANLRAKDAKPLHKLLHPARILSASFSPDGTWIVTGTGGLDSSARVWDRDSARLMGIFRHAQPLIKVWMPHENHILTLSRRAQDAKSQLRFWNVAAAPQADLSSLEQLAARKVSNKELRIEKMNTADFPSPKIP